MKRTTTERRGQGLTFPAALPVLLTADDTAAVLKTTRAAVYAMVERGQLPGVVRIGRRLRVDAAELVDWLDQKRAPSKE